MGHTATFCRCCESPEVNLATFCLMSSVNRYLEFCKMSDNTENPGSTEKKGMGAGREREERKEGELQLGCEIKE